MNTVRLYQNNMLCSGCGTCAAVCALKCLEIKDNDFGEYRPFLHGECTSCGVCLKVCPFNPEGLNEDAIATQLYGNITGIQRLPLCGYFLAAYIGYSQPHRLKSASGGLATWFLEYLLVNKIVEAVICVGKGHAKNCLLEYKIVENTADLRACSGSAYYAVEMSQVLQKIKQSKKRCAIVGVPCFIKAIRLASKYDKVLKTNISVTIGLVCGHLPAKSLVDFVAWGADKTTEIREVKFRLKDVDAKESNLNAAYIFKDNTKQKYFFEHDLGLAHGNKLFTQRACEFCDDIYAECADVVFMDAWLAAYSPENRIKGLSLVIARSTIAKFIFDQAKADIKPIPINKVIEAQMHVGVVQYKREALYIRTLITQLCGRVVPKKRVVKPPLFKGIALCWETLFQNMARRKLRKEWSFIKEHPTYFRKLRKSLMLRLRFGWLFSGRYACNVIKKISSKYAENIKECVLDTKDNSDYSYLKRWEKF